MQVRPTRKAACGEFSAGGRVAYAENCLVCHGSSAAGGILPDLRQSAAFDAVLIDGVLKDNGMISFKGKLSPDEIEALRNYLMERSSERQ